MNKKKESIPSIEEKILRRIPAEILLLSFLAALLALIFLDVLIALFIFAGGVLSALSFLWLKASMTRFLIPDKKRAVRSVIALFWLRLLLLLAVFFIIIIFFSEKVIAVAVGFSMIIPVCLAEGILGLAKMKKWKS
jgi:hypothetical protein